MKKLVVLLSVAIMAIGTVTTVFAQPSVNVDGVVSVGGAQSKDESKIDILIEELDSKYKDLVDNILKPKNLKKLLGSAYSDDLQVIDTAQIYIWDDVRGKLEYEDVPGLFPVTITFNIPGVKPGSNVQILHYYDGEWHVAEGLKTGQGTVTGSFKKLSAFVFLVDKSTAAGNDGNGVEGGESPDSEIKLSPQTGESNATMYIALLAGVAFVGVVLSRKKKTA